ncbi:MAG: hypothetical protein K9L26_03300, partial [Candidatus Izimaplasma sp.]|nr:hypothetical protein [Candidatus Izimaplasma bacterium]
VFLVLQDYLLRFKIKPKVFWENNLSKQKRNTLLNILFKETDIPLHLFYKHSRILSYNNTYFIVYYKDTNPKSFIVKKDFN